MDLNRCARVCYILLMLGNLVATNTNCSQMDTHYEKTVFITGGAGFIGSNFLEYLFHKYPSYRFIVLDVLTYAGSLDNISSEIMNSPRFTFVYGSITNLRLVDSIMQQANYVVHFAAESHVTRSIHDSAIFFDTDVLGTRTLMDSLIRYNNVERFIHISTSEVFGTAESIPMTEHHPLNPRTPYAAAKAAADRLVYSYQCTYDTPSVIVRPFNNYGPRQHVEKMIPRFITSVLQREPLIIHGDGSQTRDWLYVTDTCRALDMILHHPHFENIKHEVINIGSGKETSVIDIAHTVMNAVGMGTENICFIKYRPGQVAHHIASIEKAKQLLNWEPLVSLEEGLTTVIDWYQHNKLWWDTRKYMRGTEIVQGAYRANM